MIVPGLTAEIEVKSLFLKNVRKIFRLSCDKPNQNKKR